MKSEQEIKEAIRANQEMLEKLKLRYEQGLMPLEVWEMAQEEYDAVFKTLEWVLSEDSD